MTRFFTYILALAGFFRHKPVKFMVTPKGVADVPVSTYAPQLVVAVVSAGALLWAPIAAHMGWVRYADGFLSAAVWINGAWLIWNLYFATSVVHESIKSRQQRLDFRFVERLPIRVEVLDAAGRSMVATTQDLNAMGLSFRASAPLATGTRVRIPLPIGGRDLSAEGEVVRVRTTPTACGDAYVHGVQFIDLSLETRDMLELHCAHSAVPSWHARYRQSMPMLARAIETIGNLRSVRRRNVQLPVVVRVCQADAPHAPLCNLGLGMLEEVSMEGARLILECPIQPGTRVSYDVPGTAVAGSGTVVFNRAFESPGNVRFAVGVRGDRLPAHRRAWASSFRRSVAARAASNA